jgi:hypothetical protein
VAPERRTCAIGAMDLQRSYRDAQIESGLGGIEKRRSPGRASGPNIIVLRARGARILIVHGVMAFQFPSEARHDAAERSEARWPRMRTLRWEGRGVCSAGRQQQARPAERLTKWSRTSGGNSGRFEGNRCEGDVRFYEVRRSVGSKPHAKRRGTSEAL